MSTVRDHTLFCNRTSAASAGSEHTAAPQGQAPQGQVLQSLIGTEVGAHIEASHKFVYFKNGATGVNARPDPEPPKAFTSEIAPVQQGTYSASGGALQVLVPNRSLWTDPNVTKIGTISGKWR